MGRGPYDVCLEDTNQDGILDLFVADSRASRMTIAEGLGDGEFGEYHSLPVAPGASSVVSRDLDGNGYLDFIVGSYGASGRASIVLAKD